MGKGMLVDVSKCIACRGCQIACKQWWKLPAVASIHRGIHENPPELTAHTWNRIRFQEVEDNGRRKWLFTRKACNHCSEAVCVWVCPSYARGHNDQGFVSIDQERCIGCGRCGEFCPFGVPRLGVHDISKRISVQLSTPDWCPTAVPSVRTDWRMEAPGLCEKLSDGSDPVWRTDGSNQMGPIKGEHAQGQPPESECVREKRDGGIEGVICLNGRT